MSIDTENLSTGFVQNFKPNLLLDKIISKENQRIKPVEKRQEEVSVKLDTVDQITANLETLKVTTDELLSRNFWGKKKFISSNENVLTGTALNSAEPGQHYIRVDKIALSHQISSQSFKGDDVIVAQGEFTIKIGDSVVQTVSVGPETTLKEFVDDINASDATIKASIIKTNESEFPYQVVLSSETLGEEGRIQITGQLEVKGENEVIPNFLSSYTDPSEWKHNRVEQEASEINEEAVSNSTPKILQRYRGSGYNLLFTVVNTGRVGESDALDIRWVDQENPLRTGIIKLDKFNYAAGKPVEVANGLILEFGEGDLILHDSFTISSEKSNQVTPWSKKFDAGSPRIGGVFIGEDDLEYTLRVVQGGTIGKSENVIIEYLIDDEPVSQIDLGKDYVPGTKVDIGNGLDLTLDEGILNSGYETVFEVEPSVSRDQWWRFGFGGDDDLPQEISMDIIWQEPETPSRVEQSKFFQEKSTAGKQIIGNYTGNFDNVYTFTVVGEGTVGTTNGLKMEWTDSFENSGEFDVGSDYVPGAVLPIDEGLSLIMNDGLLFEADYFTVNAYSPVVRAAQDAEIRLGASRDDDGILVKHSSNELKDVIQGVTLNLQAPSEETIVVTIEHDIENVVNQVKAFVENTNVALLFLKESTKYDVETKIAAPLQAEFSVISLYRLILDNLINPVTGLPVQENTLTSIGIELNKQGQLELDESKLNQTLTEEYEQVANLFRSYGDFNNDAIQFLDSAQETEISGLDGYDVTITKAATQGKFESQPILGPVIVNEFNNKFRIIINQRESEDIVIDSGSYTLDEFIEKVQIEIAKDPIIANLDHVVLNQENKLIIKSGRYGQESFVKVDNQSDQLISALTGSDKNGSDAEGRIEDVNFTGTGRLLTAPENTKFEGLKIYSKISDAQIQRNENTANMIFTKGVAQKITDLIKNQLKEKSGSVDILNTGYKNQLEELNEQIERFNTRINDKKQFIAQKLARTEAKLGSLQEEGRYINSQIAQLQ